MKTHLNQDSSLVTAIEAIERSNKRIAIILNNDNKLIGTITDGDIRRCILSGGNLDTSIKDVMNSCPVSALEDTSNETLFNLMKINNILAIPLVTSKNMFVKLVHISEISKTEDDKKFDISTAVIMAGGLGMRLRPITKDIPKPMVDIGGMPLLERQINR